jgi:hypothetical protein
MADLSTSGTIKLFDIKLIDSHWDCSLQGLNEESDTIAVILERELIMPEDTPKEQRIKCVYTFDNINKAEEELIAKFKLVIGNFKNIGGEILAVTLKESICKAAQKEELRCQAKV